MTVELERAPPPRYVVTTVCSWGYNNLNKYAHNRVGAREIGVAVVACTHIGGYSIDYSTGMAVLIFKACWFTWPLRQTW